jgi:hypothetical protein
LKPVLLAAALLLCCGKDDPVPEDLRAYATEVHLSAQRELTAQKVALAALEPFTLGESPGEDDAYVEGIRSQLQRWDAMLRRLGAAAATTDTVQAMHEKFLSAWRGYRDALESEATAVASRDEARFKMASERRARALADLRKLDSELFHLRKKHGVELKPK